MPAGGHTSAMLPDKKDACLPSNPPRKYSAIRITTRVSVVSLTVEFVFTLPGFISGATGYRLTGTWPPRSPVPLPSDTSQRPEPPVGWQPGYWPDQPVIL